MTDSSIDNRNSPSYLSKYGFSRAPFASAIEHDMFYAEPSRDQRLDILLHLSQYSHDLLLVTGSEDSGKTTLLNQFLYRTPKTWKTCQIDAHPLIDEEQLILRISHGLKLQVEHFDIGQATEDLKIQLTSLLSASDCTMIIVDNAHILEVNALKLLCELSRVIDNAKGVSLRVLMFSESSIRSTLHQLEVNYRSFDLPPFTEQDTRGLILHRLGTSGLKDPNVFTESNTSKIFKLSGGVPGKILEISHRILSDAPVPLGPVPESTARKSFQVSPESVDDTLLADESKQPSKILRLTGILTIGLFLSMIVLFQDEINHLFKGTPATNGDPKAEAESAKKTTIALKIPQLDSSAAQAGDASLVQPSKSKSAKTKTDEPDKALLVEDDSPVVTEPTPPAPTQTASVSSANKQKPAQSKQKFSDESSPAMINTPEPTTTEVQTPGVQPPQEKAKITLIPKPKQKDNKATATKTGKTGRTGSGTNTQTNKSEKWILKQNPNHYTLQLVAGYKRSTVTNFINKYKLNKRKTAYYYSLNKGKAWHSLIYGSYVDYASAKAAANKLRKTLNKTKPWVRKFKSIQRDIKSNKPP